MSTLKRIVIVPLAGAILITAFAAGGSAMAAPKIHRAENPNVTQVGGGRPHHSLEQRRWHGHRPDRWERMGPRQIRRSLRHRGFDHIRILDTRGPVYVVKAHGWRGAPLRLVVDAFSGRILRQDLMGAHFRWSYRW